MKSVLFSLVVFIFSCGLTVAQESEPDSLVQSSGFRSETLLVPSGLIALSMYSSFYWDENIQQQAIKWNGNTPLDNGLILVPGAAIYILDWCGIPSKHSFTDKTVIAATTAAFTLSSTFLLKATTRRMRPNENSDQSFPSGHTAVAFACAELLRQEYQDQSVWYGVAGYGIASVSGFLRVYNNDHWFSDVLFGAGIGILSAQMAYYLYPTLKKIYTKNGKNDLSLFPSVSEHGFGLGLSARF
ncbi:MAG: phosphatase PAP2 family protein [Dysgonamonadaceae bacterium]|nr:phosphatase PAP2 family protein [Dysgonamonadaceae bacterium]